MAIPKWLANAELAPAGLSNAYTATNWMWQGLWNYALLNGQTVYTGSISGDSDDPDTVQNIVQWLQARGGVVQRANTYYDKKRERINHWDRIMVFDHGYATVNGWGSRDGAIIEVQSMDSAFVQDVINEFRNKLTNTPAGKAYALLQGATGMELVAIGSAQIPFERGNYIEEVCGGFDHIVEDLKKPNPCGRIAILDGEPGTGKTHLVRAMVGAAPAVTFVIVPPDLVRELTGPQVLKVLKDHRHGFDGSNSTICFIVEDADSCLVPRGGDNMGSISSMLNITDGILGAMLDVRIIATTNAGHLKDDKALDPAILRSGRLCRRVNVGKLSADHLNDIFERLGGK
jgi:hypothetical protein